MNKWDSMAMCILVVCLTVICLMHPGCRGEEARRHELELEKLKQQK